MANFKAEVFQNQFMAEGASEVHAIMTVAVDGAPGFAASGSNKMFGILCDVSGSMAGEKMHAAKDALSKLVQMLPDDVHFFLVAGSAIGQVIFPAQLATPDSKTRALNAIRAMNAEGGTVISTWLEAAINQFRRLDGGVKQALLMTDGQNDETDARRLDQMIENCRGLFQCDCRGVGTDWDVPQLKKVGSKLLGTVDIIANPAQIEADFKVILAQAMAKSVGEAHIRLWNPVGARILFCKQVSPEIADLTQLGRIVKGQVTDFPTGAWSGSESRDYHFAIQVKPGGVGDEMLAGRASLVVIESGVETKVAEARILAIWTDDEAKSTRIERHVAHYTGQAELAQSIQDGLEARTAGDSDKATALLGKAVKIAHESGNEATAKLLRTVVDVEDPATGTVRLKRGVAKEDEMALETRSTKTKRVQKN
ncbi:MAG TPA: VWA domain-containing protein [Bryobacteraceae bacterium]|jgi:uncharacterized protein YegL